jgi:hypothetical protein
MYVINYIFLYIYYPAVLILTLVHVHLLLAIKRRRYTTYGTKQDSQFGYILAQSYIKNETMNSVDSLRLSSALKMPLKQIQRLSLQQTEIIDKFTHSIPACFRDFIAISPTNALLGI